MTTTYTWDSRNRLTGISKTGLTASFVYDGLGRRTSKAINGTTMGFWYDGNDVYAELSGATPAFTYIRGLSIDEPYIRKGASGEFYETDALGSSVAWANSAGANQTTYTYEPFGTTTQAGTASTNPFQFAGRENDGTGLAYYRARYYSPRLQRFITQDPIGFLGGDANLYAYVANDPVNQSDPLGLYGPTGAAGSAAASAILQIGSNLIQTGVDIGGSLRCVNVNNVVVSGVLGAVGPTLGQQVLRGIPGPGEISRIAETLIYIETVVPLGVLTKMALPDLTIGNLLRALSLPVALSGRKSECEGLSLGNAISTIVQ